MFTRHLEVSMPKTQVHIFPPEHSVLQQTDCLLKGNPILPVAWAKNLEVIFDWPLLLTPRLSMVSDLSSEYTQNHASVQYSSIIQSCPTLCEPMNCSMPGLPIHHQLPEFTQTHVHWVGDTIQPSHPLSSLSSPALNLSQHQGLLKRVSSSHQVDKVLEFQLQHQSFQWTPRTDLL